MIELRKLHTAYVTCVTLTPKKLRYAVTYYCVTATLQGLNGESNMGIKGIDVFDGRLTYEADINEIIEIEVADGQYEKFKCIEGKNCKGCDLNWLSIDYCLNFPCTKSGRTDCKYVHFKWEKDNA